MKLLEESDKTCLLSLLIDTREEASLAWLEGHDVRLTRYVRSMRRGAAEAIRNQANALLTAMVALDVKGLPGPLMLQEGGQST